MIQRGSRQSFSKAPKRSSRPETLSHGSVRITYYTEPSKSQRQEEIFRPSRRSIRITEINQQHQLFYLQHTSPSSTVFPLRVSSNGCMTPRGGDSRRSFTRAWGISAADQRMGPRSIYGTRHDVSNLALKCVRLFSLNSLPHVSHDFALNYQHLLPQCDHQHYSEWISSGTAYGETRPRR